MIFKLKWLSTFFTRTKDGNRFDHRSNEYGFYIKEDDKRVYRYDIIDSDEHESKFISNKPVWWIYGDGGETEPDDKLPFGNAITYSPETENLTLTIGQQVSINLINNENYWFGHDEAYITNDITRFEWLTGGTEGFKLTGVAAGTTTVSLIYEDENSNIFRTSIINITVIGD